MNRTLTLITLVLALLIPTIPAAAADGKANIQFTEKSYDFGTIREADGKVSHEFEFTNTGDAPLVIISAIASCGCTKPTYTTDPIAPGKKGKIKVTYNPSGRPGEFNRDVKVRTNAPKAKRVNLKISGVVLPARSN